MRLFLNENQVLSSIPDDEFSQQLPPFLPKTKHTGSIADTMQATAAVQERGDNPLFFLKLSTLVQLRILCRPQLQCKKEEIIPFSS